MLKLRLYKCNTKQEIFQIPVRVMMKGLALYCIFSAIMGKTNTLSVRSVVNQNMKISKFLESNLLCKSDIEYAKHPFPFRYAAYLVSYGPNVTGKYAVDVQCSGSLVTASYIVTAAHCFYEPDGGKKDLSTLTAVTGTTKIGGANELRQYRRFAEAWIHSEYRPLSFYKDFAIGELSSPLALGTFGVDVIYFYLPFTLDDVLDDVGKICTAVGFWRESGTSEVDAQCVRQMNLSECNYTYGLTNAICVGATLAPFKEQGSPLVCYDGKKYSVLTGVMLSAVRDNSQPNGTHWPALYARVKDFWDDTCVKLSQAKD